MKLIIAGSRTFCPLDKLLIETHAKHWNLLCATMIKVLGITEVVCGCAAGADFAGRQWAVSNNIAVIEFPAEWYKFGRKAGPIRNQAMAIYADQAVVFWDGKSRGAANMILEMQKLNKPVQVVRF